jgi:hypothetical protein
MSWRPTHDQTAIEAHREWEAWQRQHPDAPVPGPNYFWFEAEKRLIFHMQLNQDQGNN